jgi:hypothetical protein
MNRIEHNTPFLSSSLLSHAFIFVLPPSPTFAFFLLSFFPPCLPCVMLEKGKGSGRIGEWRGGEV